jgi:hypothetical protein
MTLEECTLIVRCSLVECAPWPVYGRGSVELCMALARHVFCVLLHRQEQLAVEKRNSSKAFTTHCRCSLCCLPAARLSIRAGYLWQPVIERSEDRHHVGPDQNVMDVSSGRAARFSPGEKHWHGATPSTGMTHIAIQEKKDGKVVDWMEHVSDEQYRK